MSVETNTPQTEEKEQKCWECKKKAEFQEKYLEKLKDLVEKIDPSTMADSIKLDAVKNGDPLSRYLVELVDNSPIEDKKALWEVVSYALTAHFSYEKIETEMYERAFAAEQIEKVNSENSLLIKATIGEQAVVMTVPLKALEKGGDTSDEEVINFCKEHNPNLKEFEKAEFKVLRGAELDEEIAKNKEMLLGALKGEEKCQTNNEQTIKQ